MGRNNPEIKFRAESMQPASKLHPSKGAYEYIRGLGPAHMDAYLKNKEETKGFLASDLKSLFAEREIDVTIYYFKFLNSSMNQQAIGIQSIYR